MSLRAGDWVEVRSEAEILANLDEQGELDALPFMPEMLQYCGKRFRVYKSAHKTCDTIQRYTNRRMREGIHLEGLRCDGMAHGGCQAGCLLFWKDAWLKPIEGPHADAHPVPLARPPSQCSREMLERATHATGAANGDEARYRCQATEMLRATTPLAWWDPRQYARDIVSGNVRLRDLLGYLLIAVFNSVMRLHWRGRQYPYIRGLAGKTTPTETLNLQPNELVQVRTKAEIVRTLNADHRNRGLWFDMEMVPFCGRTFRVLRRVERIINDRTGLMIRLPGACLILDGVTCSGCLSTNRLFCPRSIYPYWHEIWLRRVENGDAGAGASR